MPSIGAMGHVVEFVIWCQDVKRATAGHLIRGAGGFGKTRLMIEIARRLRAQH